MYRMVKVFVLLVFASMAMSPLAAVYAKDKVKGEVVMKEGKKVHLFHSGTADVKKDICLNDVIPVFRETPAGSHMDVREVGKVKVLSYVGEHYFEAEVVKGEIKVGDVAKKEGAYCLVQPVK
jgi:hypothetical protein